MNFAPSTQTGHSHSSSHQRVPSYPTNRHRQHSAPAHSNHKQLDHPTRTNSQESNTLEFTSRRLNKQPLYRPAALRRNNTQDQFLNDQLLAQLSFESTPPRSPSLCVVEGHQSSPGWLGSFASWTSQSSPSSRQVSPEVFDGSEITGVMCPREEWKPDEQALICADSQCTLRFGLLERRHHCRQCGQVYCASHSSRNTLLWQSPADSGVPLTFSIPPTPSLTPRSTPRRGLSRTPSYSHTPAASEGSQTPTAPASPPQPQPLVLPGRAMPMSVRVCDGCFFSAPNKALPLMSPALGAAGQSAFSFASGSSSASLSTVGQGINAGPVTFRASSRHRTPGASPAGSPPGSVASGAFGGGEGGGGGGGGTVSRRTSRSRQNSAHTTSSSLDSHRSGSTPPTSLDGGQSKDSLKSTDYKARPRGVSPATSIRRSVAPVTQVASFPEESDLSSTEDEDSGDEGEGADGVPVGPKVGIFGSVANGWATF